MERSLCHCIMINLSVKHTGLWFVSSYWFMFLKPNMMTLFHPGDGQRKKQYSTLCNGLCTWSKRKISKSIMNYKAGDVERELNILDDSTVNNRVLTAFEFNRCFSHSCIKCYHGNYWTPSGRGRPPLGTCVTQLSKGWTTWREQVLMSAVNVGCCDKARWELVQFSARSKQCWSPWRYAFGQQDICLLSVWWSSPWWEDTLLWFC